MADYADYHGLGSEKLNNVQHMSSPRRLSNVYHISLQLRGASGVDGAELSHPEAGE
jgi:hypothetical protein